MGIEPNPSQRTKLEPNRTGTLWPGFLPVLHIRRLSNTLLTVRLSQRSPFYRQRFFSEGIALSGALHGSHLCRHNFREIAVKNYEKSKNRRKILCAPLRIDS